MTGSDLVRRFRLDQQRRGLADRTITEREKLYRRFEDAGHEWLYVTREDIEEWLDTFDATPRTRTVYIGHLRAMFDWLHLEEIRHDDPTKRIRRPVLQRMKPRPIGDDDLAYAIGVARPRMKAWLCLAAYQGLRCKEIAELRREDVLDKHDPPLLRVAAGKGGHEAILPLNAEALVALHQYGMPPRGYIFTRPERQPGPVPYTRRYTAGTVSATGGRYLRSIGIDASMHQLRHWFGTAVWSASKDLRVTQEMMRHAHPATTAGYSAFDDRLAQAVVAGLKVGA